MELMIFPSRLIPSNHCSTIIERLFIFEMRCMYDKTNLKIDKIKQNKYKHKTRNVQVMNAKQKCYDAVCKFH